MVQKVIPIVIVWCLFLQSLLQNESALEKLSLLDKQAVANVQRILASELDAELPKLPFAKWFGQIVGPRAGVIWQLSECGEQLGTPTEPAPEMQACTEANAILPDGRKIVVLIHIGTFKKGMTGKPTFFGAFLEKKDQLHQIRRLRDLQSMLSAPETLHPRMSTTPVDLPPINLPSDAAYLPPPSSKIPLASVNLTETDGEPPPTPPQSQKVSEEPGLTVTSEVRKLSGAVVWGDAVTKVQPRYPANAKKVNASGPVEVQITISEVGRVSGAKAISGHVLLRDAAVEAARQWIFKPATLNGVPVETQTVLTFFFRVPQ